MSDKSGDTSLGNVADTHCRSFVLGQKVKIVAGPLEGMTGTIIERRDSGRVVVCVQCGVYLEIQEFCIDVME